MKLGNNEKTVLAILNNHRNLTERQLHTIFRSVTKKEGRIDTITHSLRLKGFITNDYSIDKSMIKNIDLPKISLESEFIKELEVLDDVKLGSLGKSIIYVLHKTEKSSLQFLSTFFAKPSKNIYAILQRLEERGMVNSYNSRLRRVNSAGRRYHPKYYVLTDHGNVWMEINIDKIKDKDKIDRLLEEPEKQIQNFNLKF